MQSARCQVSSCNRCRFYAPEGRRGGHCSQLGVAVEGRWMPCSLAVPVFTPALVEMQPLDFLPGSIDPSFPEVLWSVAGPGVGLDAPATATPAAQKVAARLAPLAERPIASQGHRTSL
jgi:hypothetical protein